MATPTPTTKAVRKGDRYYLSWTAAWSTTDNFTDSAVIDRSALGTPSVGRIEVVKLVVWCTAGIDALFEYEHSGGDVFITKTPLGNTVPFVFEPPQSVDGFFAFEGDDINQTIAAASDGDVLLTTTSAGSGDVITFHLWARLHLS